MRIRFFSGKRKSCVMLHSDASWLCVEFNISAPPSLELKAQQPNVCVFVLVIKTQT